MKDNLNDFIEQFSSDEVKKFICCLVVYIKRTKECSGMDIDGAYRFMVDLSISVTKSLDAQTNGRSMAEIIDPLKINKNDYMDLTKKGQDILSDMI